MTSPGMSEAEIRAAIIDHVTAESAKPLQEQLGALQARQMLLEVGFLRQQQVIERLVGLLEREP